MATEFYMYREVGGERGGGGGCGNEHAVLRRKFIIMFTLQDHLPLDRIITRFSAPTTITPFLRSSLYGILIELAQLVTHGANDNIFCLSGLIESTGGGARWFGLIPIRFLSLPR